MKWTEIPVTITLKDSELAVLKRWAADIQKGRGKLDEPVSIERAIDWLVCVALMREEQYQQDKDRRQADSVLEDTPKWLRDLVRDALGGQSE